MRRSAQRRRAPSHALVVLATGALHGDTELHRLGSPASRPRHPRPNGDQHRGGELPCMRSPSSSLAHFTTTRAPPPGLTGLANRARTEAAHGSGRASVAPQQTSTAAVRPHTHTGRPTRTPATPSSSRDGAPSYSGASARAPAPAMELRLAADCSRTRCPQNASRDHDTKDREHTVGPACGIARCSMWLSLATICFSLLRGARVRASVAGALRENTCS